MADRLRVRLLGPLDVTVGDSGIGPEGSFRRSLFALLALHANEVVGMDELVDGLWGDSPPRSATGVVQTYVSTWRRSLDDAEAAGGKHIATSGTGYRLRLDEDESDLLLFQRLADEGRRLAAAGSQDDGRTALERALALRRGPVLAGLSERPFHASAVEPIQDRLDQAGEDWAEIVLRTGTDDDLPAVVSALQRLRKAHPWRERSTELLMWALFCQARQRDALEVYEQTRRRLADELGVDPGSALREMHNRVLRQESRLFSRTSGRRVRRAARLDSFVGREGEVDDVCDLLGTSRLVTLTGPGGSGKTRLAEEVAEEMEVRSRTSTAVVELVALDDAALVPGAIATRLGLQPAETLPALVARLLTRLVDRPLLLVLDNLEQIPDIGTLVSGLLRGTTALRVLATSREPLRVAGEQQFAVQPLPVPAADECDPQRLAAIPSIVLLVDRARAVDPRTAVTEIDAAALRDVVRAVDGLPLALEIAAPWLASLTPAGLLAELRHLLDLPGRRTDVAKRHRTMRAMTACSFDRLSIEAQRLLARLSVLRGSGDLGVVRALGGSDLGAPTVDVLMDLLDHHLVQPAEPVEGAPRFRLLETVRQFAAERLAASGEQADMEMRAAEWFACWAVGLAAHGEGPDARPWVARAIADADNLRAAVDAHGRAGRTVEQLQLVVDTFALWLVAGYEAEGERRLEAALEAAPSSAPARAIGLTFLAWFVGAHDSPRSTVLAEEAVALARAARDEPVLALAMMTLADTGRDWRIECALSTEAAQLAERLRGQPIRYAATAADNIAGGAAAQLSNLWRFRSLTRGIAWQRRAVEHAERAGDDRSTARELAELCYVHLLAGDVDAAGEAITRAGALLTGHVQGRWEDSVALSNALLLQHTGQLPASVDAMREIIRSGLKDGRPVGVQHASFHLVDLLLDQGRHAEAEAVLRRAEDALPASANLRRITRLRARRARLNRLNGLPVEAAEALRETAKGIDPDELTLEHVVWLVESALLAETEDERRSWIEQLDALSEQTGVHVPAWERRWLTAATDAP
jgi:predicted ATPase/DNA-binding SARP family transcriptional activator